MTITDYLWIDTVANSTLGFWVLNDSEYDVLPNTIGSTIHIRGRPGQYLFSSDLDSRSFTFQCQYDEVYATAALLVTKIRELISLLVNSDGTPKTLTLKIWNDPDVTYQGQYSGAMPVIREILERTGSFQLSFVAHDPIGTGAAHSVSASITTNYQLAMTIAAADVGNIESRPVITLVNAGSNTLDSIRLTILQNET